MGERQEELCRLQELVLERQHKLQILSLQIQRLQDSSVQASGHLQEVTNRSNFLPTVYRKVGRMFFLSSVAQFKEELEQEREECSERIQGLEVTRDCVRKRMKEAVSELAEVDAREALVQAVISLQGTRPSLVGSEAGRSRWWFGRATPTLPLLQQGPQCGLVALTMAARARNITISVEDVVEMAKAQGFTKRGDVQCVGYGHLGQEYHTSL